MMYGHEVLVRAGLLLGATPFGISLTAATSLPLTVPAVLISSSVPLSARPGDRSRDAELQMYCVCPLQCGGILGSLGEPKIDVGTLRGWPCRR